MSTVVYDAFLHIDPSDFELDSKDSTKGYSVLHYITQDIAENPDEKQKYIDMFDEIVSRSVTWWCKKNSLPLIDDENNPDFIKYKYEAVRYLTREVLDCDKGLSVLQLAFRLGVTDIVERILVMEDVTCQKSESVTRYDITGLIPESCRLCIYCSTCSDISCLEMLLSKKRNMESSKVEDVLKIGPLPEVERIYCTITSCLYVILAVLHMAYMIVFSYTTVHLLETRHNRTHQTTADPIEIFFYVIVPLEPVFLTIFLLYRFVKCIPRGTTCRHNNSAKRTCCLTLAYSTARYCLYIVYIGIVAVSLYYFYLDNTKKYYFLSFSLLYGWLVTFTFSKGFKSVDFFMNAIIKIVIVDVLRVLVIYIFFLVGFSLAIHVQFLATRPTMKLHHTPAHTMFLLFNVMVRTGEFMDEKIDANFQDADVSPLFSKVLYILYLLLIPIVLFNLLIAMMNNSYAELLRYHSLEWQIESIKFGISIDRKIPGLFKLFGKGTVHFGSMFDNTGDLPSRDDVWYIQIKNKIDTD